MSIVCYAAGMLVGIDEVGRGCWAGPLVAAAVILGKPIAGLKDSKKLTKLQRVRLAAVIYKRATAIGIGWVSSSELDKVGLTAAVRLAMERALALIEVPYERIIIDGNFNFLAKNPKTETLVRADAVVPVVSAASIVAKVARDQYMASLDARYAKYHFETHVGYGTTQHRELLVQHGISDLHRLSFKPIRLLASR